MIQDGSRDEEVSPSPPPPTSPRTPPHSTNTNLRNAKRAAAHRDASRAIAATVRRFWVVEILWSLVGVGCVIAIVVVLAQFDGKQPPEWQFGITLNTFLAFLASLAKAALLHPVTEGVGQLRWTWYSRNARPVGDLEVFDSATRGTFSGLALLLSFKGG